MALTELDEPERVELAMITVDPSRDTDEILTQYVQSFVPSAHGLRSEDDTVIRAAADEFGADYQVGVADDGEPEVAHTGSLYAVNDEGELVLTWPFGTTSQDIASDLDLLLKLSA
ncbi:MAG: SCO family protein [Acidimicrobiales bacterium]